MLRSGNDSLGCLSVLNLKEPCSSSLTNDGSGLSVESRVWLSLLNAGVEDDVDLLTLFEVLDALGYVRHSAGAEGFLQLISCSFLNTVVFCHF